MKIEELLEKSHYAIAKLSGNQLYLDLANGVIKLNYENVELTRKLEVAKAALESIAAVSELGENYESFLADCDDILKICVTDTGIARAVLKELE